MEIVHTNSDLYSCPESSSEQLNNANNLSNAKKALDDHSRLLDLIERLRELEAKDDPKLPIRDETSWTRFSRWISEQSSAPGESAIFDRVYKSDKNTVCGDDREYALFTKVPIKKDDKILSIDRKLMLSTETAMNDIDLYDFIRNDAIASAMQNVILVLHLLNEYSRGERSFWYPYLSILPDKMLPVLRLDRKMLDHLLASSHIFEALKMIRAIARQYSYFFGKLQATNLPLSRNLTYNLYCWGVSMICSRQNEVPCADRKLSPASVIHALIPVLDLCNHDRSSNQAIYESNQSKLIAPSDLESDQEITINYGFRTSGDFFIHNGFVPTVVPFDAMPLIVTLSKTDKLYPTKVKLLKILNMPVMGKFKFTPNNYENRHKRDPHLTMFLIVYSMTEDEIDFVMDHENPVGIADDIYEYLQYSNECLTVNVDDENYVSTMKKRLKGCVKEYLHKRSSIGIAMIDRTVAEIDPKQEDLVRLLLHERSIYLTHIIEKTLPVELL